MKRIALVLAAALVLPGAAAAKGPNSATVEGPELSSPITFTGHGEPGGVSPFSRLVQATGLFAVFSRDWGTLRQERPNSELGPRYTVTHVFEDVNSDAHIRQDLYPYATPSPLVYTKPGQRFFNGRIDGGWYVATDELRRVLVELGLPRTARATATGGFELPSPVVLWPAIATAVALVAAAAFVLRRRVVATH